MKITCSRRYINYDGQNYRYVYLINGFEESKNYFRSFGFSDSDATKLFYGHTIVRDGNEFYVRLEDEYGHTYVPCDVAPDSSYSSDIFSSISVNSGSAFTNNDTPGDIRPGCDFQDVGDGEWYTCESVSRGKDGHYIIDTDRGQITLDPADPVKLQKDITASQLTPKAAKKIYEAAWGADAVLTALNYTSDKLEGYEEVGDYIEVSYIGDTQSLRDELFDVLVSAGLDAKKHGSSKITYDNDGTTVCITVFPDEDASTFSEYSTGYSLSVEEIYGIDDPDSIDWEESDDDYWKDDI